ncbi:MAG: alpha/beta hydrolase [Gemmatales bacterium]
MLNILFATLLLQSPAGTPKATLDPTELPIPFQRYTTTDQLGRTVTFYLSRPPKDNPKAKLPMVLFISGSGSQSLFNKQGDRINGGIQNLLYGLANKQVRIVCVEKPGVKFLDKPTRPGGATESAEEFRREHTLPRWAEANIAALRAVWTLPDIDSSKTLVLGHSEGAITASFVAAELPQVTHVAPLAGAGPTQLYSLAALAAEPRPGDKPGDADQRREQMYEGLKKVLADPDSITSYWLGHPHRRWSSFLKHNSTELLLRSKAKVYLAHGTADSASYIGELDVLRAELAAHGRDFVVERLEGLTHSYTKPNAPPGPPQEMQALFGRILGWFLGKQPDAATSSTTISIDKAIAAQYFDEAKKLWKEDGGQLWGKSLSGAMLFVDPKTRDVVANQADAEGLLKPEGSVFVGKLPTNIFIANYARSWAGVKWVIIIWPLPEDRASRSVLMMHESWHRIQNEVGLPAASPNLNHLDQMKARYWLQLEWRALTAALLKTNQERRLAIEDALLFRRQRHILYPNDSAPEMSLEMNEGMAEYSGIKLSGMSAGEQQLYAAKKLEEQPAQVGSFLRTFAYLSGPPYGLLLDARDDQWRKSAKPDTNLGLLLSRAYDMKLPTLTESELELRAERYQSKQLKAKEEEREKLRLLEVAKAKVRYVDGPVLILPLVKMQYSFTYANLIPIDGIGIVYPTMHITDEWGALDATKGALLGSDFKTARVPAPTSKDDAIAGDGWKLTLKPGWRLVPGSRQGDYTLKKENGAKPGEKS